MLRGASVKALNGTQDFMVKRRDAFTKHCDLFVNFGCTKLGLILFLEEAELDIQLCLLVKISSNKNPR